MLAAALAEAGRFAEAVEIAERARDRARDIGEPKLARQIGARLEVYRRSEPYRQPG